MSSVATTGTADPTRTAQSLRHLGPGNFTVVMGLAGLALAWWRAEPIMGATAGLVGLALAAAAALVFAALAALSVVRWRRYPEAWAEDLRHPVRHLFVAAIPIGLILLATLAQRHFGGASAHAAWIAALWLVGCAAQGLVTLWVLVRWLRGPALGWAAVTPVLIVPIVGNVLAPLAGVGLGFEAWSAAQFGIGLVLWPVVLALLFVRLATQGVWPERLLATGFITVAPPAVVGLAALQFGAPASLGWMAWGIALVFVLWAASVLPRLKAQPFGLPWWAVSFPLAAFAALTLALGAMGPGTGPGFGKAAGLGVALLALASVVVFGLVVGTWRAWRSGTLWTPEPVAMLQPASSPG